jgi:putative flippase GtrA
VTARDQFLRFAAIGTLGFLVDAGVLVALLAGGVAGVHGGRVLSFLAAASVTWALNRRFTFAASSGARRLAEWARYLAAMAAGAAVNYAVYALAMRLAGGATLVAPLAVAAGSLAGLAVNFTTARRFVFARRDAPDQPSASA